MSIQPHIIDPEKFFFNETAFNLLMQKRINRVLLICSSYDAYMLEEDGRIDEQIFNEYVSLNLRQPPSFVHTDSAKKAFQILETEQIDLVIEMLSIPDIDTFALAHKIKAKYASVPIVVLTHFSREVSMKLKNEDLSAIDYVFCWLGNADLLLAIIKLVEDRMNAEYDIEHVGVQTILLVEDSIRFTSVYLPNLYKIIFKQSQEFRKEALNEHQRMLRMRGRPKILMATTYNEALMLYRKYKHSMLGIISDITIKEDFNKPEKIQGGVQLCKLIRDEDQFVPFVFQSSDIDNERFAQELGVGFIHKGSKTLSIDLKNYIVSSFGFGDFVFRDPATRREIARASDLVSFQYQIHKIPDESFVYHSSRNEISKWLNARSLFPIAQLFKQLRLEDLGSLSEGRDYIYKAIANYRLSRARGVIAKFNRENFDEYLVFSRIGEGSVGGKARGLIFLSSLLKKYKFYATFPDIDISVPRSVVLTTDVFEEFMDMNNLYRVGNSSLPDEEILRRFVESPLPSRLQEDLLSFVRYIKNPIAVRSSSKLEDSMYQPFAGIYSTYMIPTIEADLGKTLRFLTDAIKSVYASVYFRSSKSYRAVTSNVIDEEKMGIVLQEVCGTRYGDRFYPTFSGVARSLNFYPIKPEVANDGIVNVAFGLGKYVVDGGTSLRFSPKYPKSILQLSTPEMALKGTQKIFYSLDLSGNSFVPTVDDSANLVKFKISEAMADNSLRYVASTYDFENNMIRDGVDQPGSKVVAFSNILKYNTFPLAEILDSMLEIGQQEMGSPVEIEFAANLDVPAGKPPVFSFLQIRPIVMSDQRVTFTIDHVPEEKTIVSSNSALGNGIVNNLFDVVYVKPDSFKASDSLKIAADLDRINSGFLAGKRNYILIGPGRWGSSDPWLGIPIKWPQISEARIIIESGLENYRVDPSQGTHFFQNLTTFRVGYFTVNPYSHDGFYDIDFLKAQTPLYEDEYLCHVRFDSPLLVYIDGRKNKGVILKPSMTL
jgi:CheY-like chemotaxis protein